MSSTAPIARPRVRTAPTPPTAPFACLPARAHPPSSRSYTTGPPSPHDPCTLSPPPPLAHPLPPPPQHAIDPSAHCPFYDTPLKKISANPELYAKACPYSWEAEQFRAGEYNLPAFTATSLHPDYGPKTTHTYAEAGGSGLGTKGKKTKKASRTEVEREEDKSIKSPSSLPLASRNSFTARTAPAPYTLGQRITTAFPDIAAATRTDSNGLLPKGFIDKVNN